MDTQWMSVEAAADEVGVSRQAVTQAARDLLSLVGLARRNDAGHWELDSDAVRTRGTSGKWPVADRADVLVTMASMLAAANERAESAELRVSMAAAGETAALLRERDLENAMLRRQLEELRAEYRAVLLARSESLASER